MRETKLFLAGTWEDGDESVVVRSPWDGRPVSRVARAGPPTLDRAAAAATKAATAMAALPAERRAGILEAARADLLSRKEEIARAIEEEAGKPITLARGEVDRAGDTLLAAAHVARFPGLVARDLSGFGSGAGRIALTKRVPVGPVFAITPFNFPLNLVAHKLAPAVAAGCPVVLKPASQTPSAALLLAASLERAGLPEGALSVVPSRASDAEALATDPRFALLTFTGSAEVGFSLRRKAWDRRVALELGGNAAVIVEPDGPDLPDAARRIANAAFAWAGQSCISVQRVLVHRDVAARLRDLLVAAADAFPSGDPSDAATLCGPMIDTANRDRVLTWIESGKAAGGTLLSGGKAEGPVVLPTLLENVPDDQPIVAGELFGPGAVLSTYASFDEALSRANDSRYGLQAGVFSSDVAKVRRAWERLEVGAVIQGDVPTWRSDPMPYGGVKSSGAGREGPASAFLEMTEERMLVLR
jgi:aldehyde dehydrogenase (NAD+)/glyceraldehyde-3-phosphate dehydrogenase (NADP+)